MYFIPVGFRGDLKYLAQAFNLTRKPGKEHAAWACDVVFWCWGLSLGELWVF